MGLETTLVKPDFTNEFKADIVENLRLQTKDFVPPFYPSSMVRETKMYACSMCIEFIDKADFIPDDWTAHIIDQACLVMEGMFKEFQPFHRKEVETDVPTLIKQSDIRDVVDNYYNRFK